MMSEQTLSLVKRMVEDYPGDKFLYLHRWIAIVTVQAWSFSDNSIRADVQFERLIIGKEGNSMRWEFAVRCDDINGHNLEHKRLSGCQLRDTIVLDPELCDRANSLSPSSDKAVLDAFEMELYRV